MAFLTREEKQKERKGIIRSLRTIKKRAYSGVTSVEYEAINVAINICEMVYEREEKRVRIAAEQEDKKNEG